jgi:hypothetical protein
MKLPSCYLLLIPVFLLSPLSRWLAHLHGARFFLGLSSDFWTGVAMGSSIICAASFMALLVLHLYSAKTTLPGELK